MKVLQNPRNFLECTSSSSREAVYVENHQSRSVIDPCSPFHVAKKTLVQTALPRYSYVYTRRTQSQLLLAATVARTAFPGIAGMEVSVGDSCSLHPS